MSNLLTTKVHYTQDNNTFSTKTKSEFANWPVDKFLLHSSFLWQMYYCPACYQIHLIGSYLYDLELASHTTVGVSTRV